jgi:hypothetical protein
MIGTSLKTLILIFFVGAFIGGIIEWFAKDRWIELLMYKVADLYGLPIPIGLILGLIAIPSTYILVFSGRGHD